MSMTVVVTRNVPDRYRGFLASVMLEVSPGTYVSPRMTRGVRERVWRVCLDWASLLPNEGGVTLLWREASAPGGLGISTIGSRRTDLIDHDGLWLGCRELTEADLKMTQASDQPLPEK